MSWKKLIFNYPLEDIFGTNKKEEKNSINIIDIILKL